MQRGGKVECFQASLIIPDGFPASSSCLVGNWLLARPGIRALRYLSRAGDLRCWKVVSFYWLKLVDKFVEEGLEGMKGQEQIRLREFLKLLCMTHWGSVMSWLHEFGAAGEAFDRPITGQIDTYLKHLILKPITSLNISKRVFFRSPLAHVSWWFLFVLVFQSPLSCFELTRTIDLQLRRWYLALKQCHIHIQVRWCTRQAF